MREEKHDRFRIINETSSFEEELGVGFVSQFSSLIALHKAGLSIKETTKLYIICSDLNATFLSLLILSKKEGGNKDILEKLKKQFTRMVKHMLELVDSIKDAKNNQPEKEEEKS